MNCECVEMSVVSRDCLCSDGLIAERDSRINSRQVSWCSVRRQQVLLGRRHMLDDDVTDVSQRRLVAGVDWKMVPGRRKTS